MKKIISSLIILAICVAVFSTLFILAPTTHAAGLTFNTRAQGGSAANAGSYSVTADTIGTDLKVVMYSDQVANNVTSVTDNSGGTYVRAGSEYDPGTGNYFGIFYSTDGTSNSSNVVTVNLSGNSQYRSVVVYDISGQAASPLDTTSTGTGASANITTGTFSLAAPSEIITAIMIQYPPITAGTGYTLVNYSVTGDPTAYFADEYHITSSDEPATATGNYAAFGSNYTIMAASFKAASTGTINTPHVILQGQMIVQGQTIIP